MIKKISRNRRCFHGYHQHKEEYSLNGKTVKRWMFYVTGFCFDDKHVHIMKSDGTEVKVAIDEQDRILIIGKRFGRNHWNH